MRPLISPQIWRLSRDRADGTRRLLVRAWWLIVALILVVAAIFHGLGADVFPWMFGFAVITGLGCWMLVLGWAQGYYLLMSYVAKRSDLREKDRAPTGR